MTIIEIITKEAVDAYGEYDGKRKIDEKNPNMACESKNIEPDYLLYCSKYIWEAIYTEILVKGFQMVTCITEETFSFRTTPPEYFRYQFPKLGVIHLIPNLTRGYLLQKVNSKDEYKVQVIEKV